MKAITEYIQKKHIEQDMDCVILEPIREYVKTKWGGDVNPPSDELVPGLRIQDIFDVKEKQYTIYCKHENVYLHIKCSEENFGTYIVAVFTRSKDEPKILASYSPWESASYQYNARQKKNHLFNFWQMLSYAISNSELKELKK